VQARKLSARPQLFVDFEDVDRQENVTRRFHPAEKARDVPVLKGERPWEQYKGAAASFIHDDEEQIYKVWYLGDTGFDEATQHGRHVQCYATSHDAIHWERPNLGLHEVLGTRENNVVIPASHHDGMDHWESMLKDPFDPDPDRRYKALGWSSYGEDLSPPRTGIYSATSPDGFTWSHSPDPVFWCKPRDGTDDLGPVGDAQAMMIDTLKKRYVAFLRGGGGRMISISEDFVTWTPPETVLWHANEEDLLYNQVGFVYGDQYLGLLTHLDRHARRHTCTLQLVMSRDGEHWQRAPCPPIISPGEIGEWDRFLILLTGAPPVRVGDKLHIYYRGFGMRHSGLTGQLDARLAQDDGQGPDSPATGALGLATLRVDGFASINASFDGGTLTTVPLEFTTDELSINVKADFGRVFVELLDEEDKPLLGYSKADAIPIEENSVAASVGWKAGRSLAPLRGQAVKIRFHLVNARLYSYTGRDTT
jgi:hypothetical protein